MAEAVEIAEAHGAAVHVLHVINTRYYDTSIESAVAPLREEAESTSNASPTRPSSLVYPS